MEDDKEEDGPLKKKRKTREERAECERKLLRTIFVGNLPITVKPKHLVREFSKYGSVENARLRSVPLVDVCIPLSTCVPFTSILLSCHLAPFPYGSHVHISQ
jgi:RNA recognition motif-containing protein